MTWRRIGAVVLLWALRPAAALHLPADAVATPIHPGAWSFRIRRTAGPQAIDGFYWERAERRLTLRATDGADQVYGLEPTSRQIARLTSPQQRAVAAVNGDFYVMSGPAQGVTIGLFVRQGELLGVGNSRAAFAWLGNGEPYIGEFGTTLRLLLPGATDALPIHRLNSNRAADTLVLYSPSWSPSTRTDDGGTEVLLRWSGKVPTNGSLDAAVAAAPVVGRGDLAIPPDGLVLSAQGAPAAALGRLQVGQRLRIEVSTEPAVPVAEAVGGHPILLAGGKLVYQPKADEPRHPRTAMGFDDQHILAVTVDGRRPGHSAGMTFPELAKLLAEFGCREGVNLDGGGSTTCWARGSILNRPSDGRERSVANALALVSLGPLGEPAAVAFEPGGPVRLAPGASFQPQVRLTDALYNPLTADTPVTVTVEGEIGAFHGQAFQAGPTAGRGRLLAQAGQARGELAVEVVAQVASLRVEPSTLALLAGEQAELAVAGADSAGRPVLLSPAALRWSLEGAGQLAGSTFTAGAPGSTANLRVSGYGASAVVPVQVAAPQLIEGFEAAPAVRFDGFPETVSGSVELLATDAAEGGRAARLTYRLTDAKTTRAAYLRLDRAIGGAFTLRCRVRGDGQPTWLRAAVLDGNGQRSTFTLLEGPVPTGWTLVEAALPRGLKQPLTWESVYVVQLDNGPTRDGWVEWDQLEAVR
ncbi:MAG: phosphodiester glycosidase family protein [Fimbriimonadaceae bacterium]|nr:phosphodiester glycosidase family protein [Fimbriimonadaceae bacterium]